MQHLNNAQPPAPASSTMPALPAGAVVHGTCGWSDQSLVRCGRFYPPSMRSGAVSEDKLRHYSRHFGCVEVDTSCYAIPRPDVTKRWAQAAAPGFLFHVKAFGPFCSMSCQASALPAEARALLPLHHQGGLGGHLRLDGLPAGVEAACWRLFHAALEPLYRAGKLGLVLFQFHLSFGPSQPNLEHILRCRARLDPRFRMAAEVRCRRWFTDPSWRRRLVESLQGQGISLVSADELEHETAQRDREQTGLPPGAVSQVLPICLEVTTPECHYVRVHRRHGTTDRLLPPEEIDSWAARLAHQLAPRLRGPCYFLWGTDWEDSPMVNARSLDLALPCALRFDWQQHCRAAGPQRGSIHSLFARQAQQAATQQAAQQAQQAATQQAAQQAQQAAPSRAGDAGGSAAGQNPLHSQQYGGGIHEHKSEKASPAAAGTAGKRERGGGAAGPVGKRKSGGGSILRFLQQQPPVT